MKNKLLIIIVGLSCILGFSQDNTNLGIIAEYNKPLQIEYIMYNPPLKIGQINKQSKIDYSNLEGLIQSFYSASNLKWALSDYLDKEAKTDRDQEHFDAVRKTDVKKNYIQIETVYKFEYNTRPFTFIKYSFIMDKVPFPFIGMMSAEKFNGRWYISDLLNQSDVKAFLSTFDQNVVNDLFGQKSDNVELSNIANKLKNIDGYFDFTRIIKMYSSFMNNPEAKQLLKDKRLTIKDTPFRNAELKSIPKAYKYQVSHPFILSKSIFSKYKSKNQKIIKDEKTTKRFLNKPESLLLKETPISLINKFYFIDDNTNYYIIKYLDGQKKTLTIKGENGTYSIFKSGKFKDWEDLFLNIKSDFFIELSKKGAKDGDLKKIKEEITSISEGVNLDLLSEYVKENKSSLSKYLEE